MKDPHDYDEDSDGDNICNSCGFPDDDHMEGCPDDDSPMAELIRNGYA